MRKIPIIWVDIERSIPSYLYKNIALHYELCPNRPQILLTDHRVPSGITLGLSIFDISQQSHLTEFYSNMNRTTGQIEFWVNTTKRFLILENFMKSQGIDKAIHQESDNVILRAEHIDSEFEYQEWGIAYPLQASGIGCASILLINEVETLEEFNRFVKSNWHMPNQDDMRLLGEFSVNPKVKVLNSIPNGNPAYDPQTYGRYLLGTDARNMRWPFSKRGIVDERSGSVNIIKDRIDFEFDNRTGGIQVHKEDEASPLVNIHIHSKRIPRSLQALNKMLKNDVNSIESSSWHRGVFDRRVFAERLISWFKRKILRIHSETRLR